MKGLWKENLGGWNHKGSRRKKTTRNNTLRDNGRAIIKIYDYKKTKNEESIFNNDLNSIYVEDEIKTKEQTQVNVCKVVENIGDGIEWKSQKKSRIAFLFSGTWFDYFSNKPLEYQNVVILTTLDVVSFLNIELGENPIKVSSPYSRFRWHFFLGGNDYIYKRPLSQWKRMTFYNEGKRRKYGQKISNGMDRARTRDFISNADWDKEIKTHAYSKSIAWLID